MPGRYSVRHFNRHNPALAEMAIICGSDDDYVDPTTRRADANETGLVAFALTAVALEAIAYDYPELVFRRLAPLQDGLSPGTEDYRWDELDYRGMAKVIENYADDLPNVAAYIKTNTGRIKSIGDAFEYTKQDIRRAMEARRLGRQAQVLDVSRVAMAREVMERTKDKIAAVGDTLNQLPGILKNANVTLLTGSTPASGSNKKWTGVDKTGAEALADLRRMQKTVRVQSKGVHTATTFVMPIEEHEALSYMPLIVGSNEQTTVLEQFIKSQAAMKQPVEVIPWQRCATADAAGTGPRVMAYERSARTVRLVEPLDFEADSPQRVSLTFKVPCESRFGSIYWRRPLGGVYMDFV
jgi:hypothetical protein